MVVSPCGDSEAPVVGSRGQKTVAPRVQAAIVPTRQNTVQTRILYQYINVRRGLQEIHHAIRLYPTSIVSGIHFNYVVYFLYTTDFTCVLVVSCFFIFFSIYLLFCNQEMAREVYNFQRGVQQNTPR